MRRLRLLGIWLAIGWGLTAVVIIASLMPTPDVRLPRFPLMDKTVHFLFYATVMSWFGMIYLPGRTYMKLGVGLLLLGVSLEFIQGLTSYRSMDMADMLSNASGILLGFILSRTRLSQTLVHIESKLGLW